MRGRHTFIVFSQKKVISQFIVCGSCFTVHEAKWICGLPTKKAGPSHKDKLTASGQRRKKKLKSPAA